MTDFGHYLDVVGMKPNSLVVGVVADFVTRRKTALDIGAGNLRDSLFYKKQGFERVVAVDLKPPEIVPVGIEFEQADIGEYMPMPDTFDIITACNTLYHLPPERTEYVLTRAYNALREGGIFACNLLGEADEWILDKREGVYCFTDHHMQALRRSFHEVLVWENYQMDFPTSSGAPHFWDFWNVVVRKAA